MSAEQIYRTDEVFGISRKLPLNYVERKNVDGKLRECLACGQHLVIFGSSKQGKTCLRKHCLKENEYVVVQCSNQWKISEIHSAILKAVGFEVTQSSNRTVTGHAKITARFGLKFFGLGSDATAETGGQKSLTTSKAPLELDPTDVNDVIRALNEIRFEKFIVLEDFHYLDTETQRDFAIALKAFHENSRFHFIIVGVWLEENRLTVYNGDLTGRVLSINADQWDESELREVIGNRECLLNIEFPEAFVNELLQASFGSVYLVQEACRRICIEAGIQKTSDVHKRLAIRTGAKALVDQAVKEDSGRYNNFITHFADGFRSDGKNIYPWVLFCVLISAPAALEKGLSYAEITQTIRSKDLSRKESNVRNLTGSLSWALSHTANLQIKKKVKPVVLDYDESNLRLRVVDRGFIIWLQLQNQEKLVSMLQLPTNSDVKS